MHVPSRRGGLSMGAWVTARWRVRLRRMAGLGLLVFEAGSGAILQSCARDPKARVARVPVAIAAAEQRPMPFALLSTGTVEPIETAAVGSQVGGTVTRLAFREGDEVQSGQMLIQLDPRPFRAALERASAALARDRALAENARSEADRGERLFQQNVIAQADLDQKRAAAAAMMATVRVDSAAEAAARLDLRYASIRAPISGRTGRLMIHVGDYVKAATSDPLVTINQTHPVRVRFTVPQDDVPLVQRYRAARPRVLGRLPGDDSTAVEGTLAFVDNAVDPQSGTLLLKGEFPNRDRRLVPGQFIDVRLVLYVEPRATVVPSVAVTTGQQGSYVYVLNPDSTVTPRPVAVERTADDMAIVARGLKPGEIVITDGQLRLSPGAKVLVRKEREGPS
ncbi:MAG: efflux RND transporter periplasmic adaptor subunit [Candidatus Eisenbacteria bacterium]|uniref:Efflux RND transporter periplasmic adaptor subunit n=1 Tax=Eiseniibacteriota bacterium TaxID=2212470 RepID=A0A538TWA8_UNCEI|nr:MAG: efflux RND transporter periplasmic adaptor subunit [Candidatus Eisenbacteria bacterium]